MGSGVGHDLQSDIDAIGRIDAVPRILDVVCRVTGMGFAAVARVRGSLDVLLRARPDRVRPRPAASSRSKPRICNEIRGHGEAVIIDHVAQDAVYCGHPMPAMYGFQSYVSVPIRLEDGAFWGTLCAIDPQPRR